MSATGSIDAALAAGGGSDFFALVRLISEMCPDAAPLGGPGPASAEALRLRGHVSLSFPPRDVMASQRVAQDGDEARGAVARLDVAFMTLYGVDSPLAMHVTEAMLRDDDPEARERVRDFLDIINHRLLSLLYRAWGRYRLHVSCRAWGRDPLSRALADLLDLPELSAEAGLGPATLLPLAGLLFTRPRSARGLEQVLRLVLPDLNVTVLSCVPREVQLNAGDRCRLGSRRSRLGRDLVLGDTVWDATSKLRIQVGPVEGPTVEELRAGGPSFRKLSALVNLWCQEPLPWDLEIKLASSDLAGARLGGETPTTRLGVNAWLGQPPARGASVFVQPSPGAS